MKLQEQRHRAISLRVTIDDQRVFPNIVVREARAPLEMVLDVRFWRNADMGKPKA